MIFQQFNLLMQRSFLKNICFPWSWPVKKADAENAPGAGSGVCRIRRCLPGTAVRRAEAAHCHCARWLHNPKVLLRARLLQRPDPTTTHWILTPDQG